MQNTIYSLTQKIHQLLPQINQKYGLEINLKSKDRWALPICNPDNELEFTEPIYPEQIRQILVSLQHLLGILADKFEKKNLCLVRNQNGNLILPLFDQNPDQVLQELVEILEKL